MASYYAKALFEYEAVEDTELTIAVDDVLEVEEVNDSGWCLVRKGDKSGWVPADYIERLEEEVPEAEIEPEPVVPVVPSKPATSGVPPGYRSESSDKPAFPPPAPAATSANPTPAMKPQQANEDLSNTLASLGVKPAGAAAAPAPDAKICHACGQLVESTFVVAKGKVFHADHFRCIACDSPLGGKPFIERDGKFYCENDYYEAFNPKCGHCDEVIKGQYISALDQSWHPEHFVCSECGEPFTGNQFRKHDNKPYCEAHFRKLFATECSKCGLAIDGQVFEAMDQKFHLECFQCEAGPHQIGEGISFHVLDGKIYCPPHFEALFLQKCASCKLVIKGQYLKVMSDHFHPECWKCYSCQTVIDASSCAQLNLKFYCKTCVLTANSGSAAPTPASRPTPTPIPAPASASTPTPTTAAPKPVSNPVTVTEPVPTPALAPPAPAANGPMTCLSYAALKNNDFDKKAVDTTRKEDYLADDIFEQLFKISRGGFEKLPAWRKKKLKQEVGLF